MLSGNTIKLKLFEYIYKIFKTTFKTVSVTDVMIDSLKVKYNDGRLVVRMVNYGKHQMFRDFPLSSWSDLYLENDVYELSSPYGTSKILEKNEPSDFILFLFIDYKSKLSNTD